MPSTLAAAAALIAGIAPIAGGAVQVPPDTAPDGGDASLLPRPVRLDVVAGAADVSLKVVGSSDRPVDARYTLRVEADGRGGRNQSSQGGAVHLLPGREVTMVDLKVASGTGTRWSAVLDVTCDDGRTYRIERRSVGYA